MKIIKKFLFFLLVIILFGVGIISGYAAYNLNGITTSISKNHDDLGINEDILAELENIKNENDYNSDEVINIALFGVDSRSTTNSSNSRSDSIIIASIDKKHDTIKLSSILRDTYVSISGRGQDKINHAYAFGGPELAIKTLNQNFGLDITNFVTVDFFGLEDIIDSIGGVTVEVGSNEVNELNKFIRETASISGKSPTLIRNSGEQVLNGMQAVSYGRIRKVGNGDYERTDRQREVLISMINSLKDKNVAEMTKLITKCASYVETSYSIPEGIGLAATILTEMKPFTIEQERFPKKGVDQKINGVYYNVADLDVEKSSLHQFIYGNSSSSN